MSKSNSRFVDFRRVKKSISITETHAEETRRLVVAVSREKYAVPRQKIEADQKRIRSETEVQGSSETIEKPKKSEVPKTNAKTPLES